MYVRKSELYSMYEKPGLFFAAVSLPKCPLGSYYAKEKQCVGTFFYTNA